MAALTLLSSVTAVGAGTSQNLAGTYEDFTFQLVNNSLGTLAAGATTAGSQTVTVTSTTGLLANMLVTGTGIPAGATVLSVTNSTTFVMSTGATATNTGLTITYYGQITAIQCDLEGSLDSNNWFPMATITKTTIGAATSVHQRPVLYIRANLLTLTGYGTPSITILGINK